MDTTEPASTAAEIDIQRIMQMIPHRYPFLMIDRGAGPDTMIASGTMIDNLVQIGHNVQLGRGCVLVSQVGISGSTRLGDFVMIGGQGGLTGHLAIGTGARIGAQAGVMRDVAAGETVMGSPALPVREFFRQVAALQRLVKKKGE